MDDFLTHNEWTEVEKPLIEQLQAQGGHKASWQYLKGSKDSLAGQGRENWREVLLKDRLLVALRRINKDQNGKEWLDEKRLGDAFRALDRLPAANGHMLMERNQAATKLILEGTTVEGVPGWDGGRDRRVQYIDWANPENNEFLIINQFRVDEPAGQVNRFICPDIVLFVNGIPLAVIEAKSPAATDPVNEAINQILRYSNQRHWIDGTEGNEQLFHYMQLTIASSFDKAVMATPGAQFEHYLSWNDCYPTLISDLAVQFGRKPSAQQMLVEGALRPERFLDVIRHFIIFMQVEGRTVKIAPRYQQYRAVVKSMERLESGQTRLQDGEFDRRGGVVFHTQGSGKSLTMVFLIRRMQDHPSLRRFKIVFITDRTDLQTQLSETAELTNQGVEVVEKVKDLPKTLSKPGPGIVFAMVQKYREPDDENQEESEETFEGFDNLNQSEDILVIVDEAHRSHAKTLHANLMAALPNAAKIGFTGTPIIMGKKKKTAEIFGEFIDKYTLTEAQEDGAILPILYEFRDAKGEIKDGMTVDQIFEEAFKERTPEERDAIQKKYATNRAVLESKELIDAKALDVIRHYIDVVLPNGFKAQLTATSRLAVMRYYAALQAARDAWLSKIEALPPQYQQALPEEVLESMDDETRFLAGAWKLRHRIKALEFAPVMSSGTNDDPAWKEWTDKKKTETRIERFKKPFEHKDPEKRDNLGFLIVKNMLLVGFDAPVEQVLYIDRRLKEDELLQAIARVNRTKSGKKVGYVVDYVSIGSQLAEALSVYAKGDVEGAFRSAHQELIDLRDRHQRVLNIFKELGVSNIDDTEACVDVLRPEKDRARFIVSLKQFLTTYGNLEHRPEARKYAHNAKTLGFINLRAHNRYRDDQLNISGLGGKVRQLIDEYVISQGVNPSIPPVDLLDAGFKAHVGRQKSDRAAASEMEHAARYHISKKYNEDPEHYERLSQRLQKILDKFTDSAKEMRGALEDFIDDLHKGRQKDETGLDPETQAPFYGVISKAFKAQYGTVPDAKKTRLIDLTVEVVEIIRQEISRVNFWSDYHKQTVLRKHVLDLIDRPDITDDLGFAEALADKLIEVAKYNHARLAA